MAHVLADAIKGNCPCCGQQTVFSGWISFAATCRACGLDYAGFNVGDGPAAFLTLIVGALVVIGAVALELGAGPPWWLHLLLWPLATLILVVFGLRVAKAALLQSEYRNRD